MKTYLAPTALWLALAGPAWAAAPVCNALGTTDPMTRAAAGQFATQWAAHWNRLEIDAVVAHLDEQAEMRSPIALTLTGDTMVKGREAIRDYWQRSYGALKNPNLSIEAFAWDGETCRLNIWWNATTSSGLTRASEFMDFGGDGRITRGEAFYGK